CSLFTSCSALFQSMLFHCFASSCLCDNFSAGAVVECLSFIGLPPFLVMKYHRISLHPFRSGQSLNPYLLPLQLEHSLFILSSTLCIVYPSYEFNTFYRLKGIHRAYQVPCYK